MKNACNEHICGAMFWLLYRGGLYRGCFIIHKSTLAWCKFRFKKSLSIVVLLLGNSLLHNGLVNSIEHACVLITLIPTD